MSSVPSSKEGFSVWMSLWLNCAFHKGHIEPAALHSSVQFAVLLIDLGFSRRQGGPVLTVAGQGWGG
jgi:phosphoribosyl 1,2-cyclic phosphodiesterase